MLMLNTHYQRLTVLLFSLWMMYSIMYVTFPLSQSMHFVYDCLLVSATFLVNCVIFDTVSVSFSVVVMYISMCVFFFSRYYMMGDPFYYRFTWLLVLFVASMNVLILSGSLLTLLLGWDGLGVSSFALIMYYQSRESFVASFMTLLINRLGDVLIMSTMGTFIVMGSTLLTNYSLFTADALMFLLMIAALTKSAQYPFCSWLPAAMAAPTPVSALVHSSTLVTAGVYILIRACSSNSMPPDMSNFLLFFGSITSFIGGCCAVFENDLKKLIALSTLSQLGVMMFSLGLGLYNLALLHLFTHAMFKALLFLVAGCILMLSFGVQDLRLLGGVSKSNPLLLVFLNVSAFCLMGFPFLSAFYSKHVIMSVMWCHSMNAVSVIMMLMSTMFSSIYMVRVLKALNWGPNHNYCLGLPYPLGYYTPLCLLFFGSCTSGWLFTQSDIMYTLFSMSDLMYDTFLYFLGAAGILLGLTLKGRRSSGLCSSMFYMVPVWSNINTLSYKFVNSLKFLDSGWLEPYSYSMSFNTWSSFLMSKGSAWPTRSFSFVPWTLATIMLLISVLCLL